MTSPPKTRPESNEIRVPGSISNLGPAFDTMSVAVNLYLSVRILEIRPSSPDTLEFEFAGTPPAGGNRIEAAFQLARERTGQVAPGLRVAVQSDIPVRAGLGSSGAATIAGLKLFEAVTDARDNADWLALAREIEGHPDNVAAALLGGTTISCQHEDGRITARAWPWPEDVKFVVATPDRPLDTSFARRILPSTLPMADAVFNLQRALLLVRALETRRYDDLREALQDRWHQPYRAPHVPGLNEALALDHPAILGVCLSGAGPSVVALARPGQDAEAARELGGLYERLGVSHTIRILSAHQPTTPS
jgi:homoserine kinase